MIGASFLNASASQDFDVVMWICINEISNLILILLIVLNHELYFIIIEKNEDGNNCFRLLLQLIASCHQAQNVVGTSVRLIGDGLAMNWR